MFCGFLISYRENPIYSKICQPPYMTLNKELFLIHYSDLFIERRNRNFLRNVNIDKFDYGFMLGNDYTKKL